MKTRSTLGVIAACAVYAAQPAVAEPTVVVVEQTLTAERFVKLAGENQINLPHLWAYDRNGRLLHDFGPGFDPAALERGMKLVSERGIAEASAPERLLADLEGVVDEKCQATEVLPAADLVLVQYWAEWCVPCHAQLAALRELLGATRGRVVIVHVDIGAPLTPETCFGKQEGS